MQTYPKPVLFFVPAYDEEADEPCVYDAITSIEETPLDCCTPDELFDEGNDQ